MADLMRFWEVLTKDATGLSVLVALGALLASVLSAAVAVWVGYETRVMRRAQTEGDVIAYLEQSSQVFQAADLVIRNVGAGVASDVTISPQGTWQIGERANGDFGMVADLGFVKHGIPILAPGQTVRTFIGMATEVAARPTRHFILNVAFRTGLKRTLTHRQFRIDFAYLDEISQPGSPPPTAMADALTKLAQDVGRVVAPAGYLRTDVRTARDRRKEIDAMRQRRNQQLTRAKNTQSDRQNGVGGEGGSSAPQTPSA